jgi:Flp pilus assembly protein TadD
LVQQHSDSPTFSFHLGVALFQKGEVAEARLQLGRALELQPSSELKKQISDTLSQLN